MVYTNIDNLKLRVPTKLYTKLGYTFVEWIEKTVLKLYTKRNVYEKRTSESLTEIGETFEAQCLFYDSKTRKAYVLDFLLTDRNIAIEIDGSSHRDKIEYDAVRDVYFKSIGITTIRIKNKDVNINNLRKAIADAPSVPNSVQTLKREPNKRGKKQTSALNNIKNLIEQYNKKYKESYILSDRKHINK